MIFRNVLVTGATGFVGRPLCELLLRGGHKVSAAVRDPGRLPASIRPRRIGDIGPDTEWVEALFTMDAVVHLAAHVHQMDEDARAGARNHHLVNALGTRHLAEAAAAHGVRRFVFVSTIKVNGEHTDRRPFTGDDPADPADPYAESKWQAERYLRDIADHTGMEVVILRPPLVYGPGVKGNFRVMLDTLAENRRLPFAAVRNRRSLLHVDNLAGAIQRCLDHAKAANRTYLVKDGEDLSTPELIRRIDAAAGRRSRLMPVPLPLLRLAGLLTGRGAQIARLTGSLVADDRPIRAELDWQPPVTVEEGLRQTVAWHAEVLNPPAPLRDERP